MFVRFKGARRNRNSVWLPLVKLSTKFAGQLLEALDT